MNRFFLVIFDTENLLKICIFSVLTKNNAFNLEFMNFFFQGEFVENGTETHFEINNHPCYIAAVSSGKQREGIIHNLIFDGHMVLESNE